MLARISKKTTFLLHYPYRAPHHLSARLCTILSTPVPPPLSSKQQTSSFISIQKEKRIYSEHAISKRPQVLQLIPIFGLSTTWHFLKERRPFDTKAFAIFLYACSTNVEDVSNRLLHELIDAFHFHCDTVEEQRLTNLISLLVEKKELQKAREMIFITTPTMKKEVILRLRTFSPLLIAHCDAGLIPEAMSLFRCMKESSVPLSEKEYTPLLTGALQHKICVQDIIDKMKMDKITFISKENANLLKDAFIQAGWKGESVQVLKHNTSCPHCDTLLDKVYPPDEIIQQMKEITKAQLLDFINSTLLSTFEEWVLRKQKNTTTKTISKYSKTPLHFIMDGPNVIHHNTPNITDILRYDVIEDLATHIESQGHLVSIVLPRRYMLPLRPGMLTNKHHRMVQEGKMAALIKSWDAKGWLYVVESNVICDDLFWMYAALQVGKQARVLSYDAMRDHLSKWQRTKGSTISQQDCLDWRGYVIAGFMVENTLVEGIPVIENIALNLPIATSRTIQSDEDINTLHIPVGDVVDSTEYLCISTYEKKQYPITKITSMLLYFMQKLCSRTKT